MYLRRKDFYPPSDDLANHIVSQRRKGSAQGNIRVAVLLRTANDLGFASIHFCRVFILSWLASLAARI